MSTISTSDLMMSELEEFMLAAEIEELKVKLYNDSEDDKLVVKNKVDADFYLKQITKLRQEQDEINDFVDGEIERQMRMYENYRQSKLKPLDAQIAYYEEALRTFVMNEYNESGKKTIKLPNGTLSIRKQQPKYVYEDETILEFLQQHALDNYIKTKYEVNKKDLKKIAQVNNDNQLVLEGKIVPGVTVIPQEDKIEVK